MSRRDRVLMYGAAALFLVLALLFIAAAVLAGYGRDVRRHLRAAAAGRPFDDGPFQIETRFRPEVRR